MKIIQSLKNYIYIYLVGLIISIRFCLNKYTAFYLEINLNSTELEIMNIKYGNYIDDYCQNWIPSLFSPILLIPSHFIVTNFVGIVRDLAFKIPIFKDKFTISLYNITFLKYYVTLGKPVFSEIVTNCYLGLSPRIYNNSAFEEEDNLLIKLYKNCEIDKKIFSFSKWTLYQNSIRSNLYLGDIHENFLIKQGIVSSCNNIKDSLYWGCYFSAIKINNNIIELLNGDGLFYKIFFSTENYDIIFPKSFQEKFYMATYGNCIYSEDYKLERNYIYCKNFFNENQQYIPITLINNNFNITIEIDHINRFNNSTDEKGGNVRIKFSYEDYFILPLIFYKQI